MSRLSSWRKKRNKRPRPGKQRRCKFTPQGQESPSRQDLWTIDYKNVDLLTKYITSQGKLFSRKRSGNSAKAQNKMKRELKYARYMALMPYVAEA